VLSESDASSVRLQGPSMTAVSRHHTRNTAYQDDIIRPSHAPPVLLVCHVELITRCTPTRARLPSVKEACPYNVRAHSTVTGVLNGYHLHLLRSLKPRSRRQIFSIDGISSIVISSSNSGSNFARAWLASCRHSGNNNRQRFHRTISVDATMTNPAS
jgi:hypothetical protein